MRTTLDIPDELFKQAKLQAVHESVTLKEIVVRALTRDLNISAPNEAPRRARVERLFAALDGKNTQPIVPLSREEIYDRGRELPQT